MDVPEVVDKILHISERPWSDYTEADYSIEQWHAACLVHLHDGPPTSKSQCKLPVKTPNGALSRNGVHAAAAALAGARSPLKASAEQKAKAAGALRRYYSQLGESPPDSLKQSAIVDEILEHHGVKGQKWGRRKESNSSSGPSRRERRANAKFEKRASSLDTKIKLNNAVTEAMNQHINRINAKYDSKYAKEIEDGVLLNQNHPITKRYYKEYNDAAISELNKQASKMTNKSGTRVYKVVENPDDFLGFTVITKDVKHADDPNSVRFLYVKDDKGRITGIKIADSVIAQSAIDDVLTHHGVKGMKWGVRRKATVGPQEIIVSDKRKKVKTSGGRGHPATESAVRARVIGQKGKKSGLKSLTDQELQDYARRIQLEQNVSRLMYNEKSRGEKFVDNFLGRQGSQLANKAAQEGGAKLGRQIVKKSALAAALAAA